MNNKYKTIAIIIASILLLGALTYGGYFVAKNFKAIVSSSKLYTEQDMESAQEESFNAGRSLYDAVLVQFAAVQEQQKVLQARYTIVRAELDEIAAVLLDGELSAESKQQLIYDIEHDIFDLSVYTAELNNTAVDLRQQVNELTEENSNLSLQISNMEAELTETKELLEYIGVTTIPEYDQLVSDLINGANFDFYVSFIYNDIPEIIHGGYFGEAYNFPAVDSTAMAVFNGWSLDGSTVITDTTFTVPAGTVLTDNKVTYTALVDRYINITFVDGNMELSAATYPQGTVFADITKPDMPSTDYIHFEGWSLDGRNLYVSDDPLNYSQTFTAVFDYYQKVTFLDYSGATVYSAFFVCNTNSVSTNGITVTTPPSEIQRYYFRGWALQGTKNIIDFDNYYLTDDIVLVPIFKDGADGTYTIFSQNFGTAGSIVVLDGKITYLNIYNRIIIGANSALERDPQPLPYLIQNQQFIFGAVMAYNFHFEYSIPPITGNVRYAIGYVVQQDILGNDSTATLYVVREN